MHFARAIPCTTALSWDVFYPESDGATMAATLDIAGNPSRRRTMRAVGFVVDDLAHTAHPTHHGCYGLVLHRAFGGFCRRDSGTADYRINGAALLTFLNRCRL